MRIAIVQLAPVKGNIEQNLINHLQWIKYSAKYQPDMIVFPELSLTGYEPELAEKLAIDPTDKRMNVLQELSTTNRLTIAVGIPTKNGNGLYVSMIIFQPHAERIVYSKQFLYPTETSIFTAGCNPLLLNFENEIVAPAICYELSIPEHNEFAAQNNASVYVASVLNSVNGIDADLEKLSIIAKKYRMTTLMANYVGQSGGYHCAGKSTVWDKNGEIVGQLDDVQEGILIYDTKTKSIHQLK
jgi:predicted amidohydrolase